MPKNVNSVQAGIVQGNNVNDPSPRVIRGKNQFPQSFQHPSTCQYGYVDPVAVAKCEPGDVFPYKFVTDLNTFTMKSPLKSEVKMYSAAFKVPMEAIYPRNYDIMLPIPNKGDDVPDGLDPTISNRALFNVKRWADAVIEVMGDAASVRNANDFIKCFILLESVFSAGSLFTKMNIHLNSARFFNRRSEGYLSIDKYIDLVLVPWLRENFNNFYLVHNDESGGYPSYLLTADNHNELITSDVIDGRVYNCSISRFLELLRTGDWSVRVLDVDTVSQFIDIPELDSNVKLPTFINIEPIVAYQLSCAHFFNNPKIDYLYSAELWRDNLQSLYFFATGDTAKTFDWNGLQKHYDICSGAYISYFIERFETYDDLDFVSFQYFMHLFAFQRSLRYGDYFTGVHPEPLAVGDIDIESNSDGSVNSLKAIEKIQLTRLLNKSNIAGPRKDDYLRVVFGSRIPEAPKDVPIRLSKEQFDVSGFEVNNTGSDQLSSDSPNITTTNLRLSDSRFMFEVEIDEPCWLVAVQYFEAHRIYANTIDRFAYHADRYDDFIPDLQFIGDQDVKQSELLGVYGDENFPFAYNLRYMEYKQRYSYASGGFIEALPSWAFVTDNVDGNPADNFITPEYIRSSPSEFDRFYKSLTGYSLGTRFHFITMNTNVAAPYRQMVYAPEILA